MKKVYLIVISILFIINLCACGTPGAKDNTNQNNDSLTSTTANRIINDEGDEFTVDLSRTGNIDKSADTISGNKINIDGVNYNFPFRISELFDNGWELNKGYDYKTEFEGNTRTDLISYYLKNKNGDEIELDQLLNDSYETKSIEECLLTGFQVNIYDPEEDTKIITPGGITQYSTAADVLSVFGDPNKSRDFGKDSYNLASQLTYYDQKDSSISYTFCFHDDGTMSLIKIEYRD